MTTPSGSPRLRREGRRRVFTEHLAQIDPTRGRGPFSTRIFGHRSAQSLAAGSCAKRFANFAQVPTIWQEKHFVGAGWRRMVARANFEHLRHVRQRTSCDCVIATAATVAQVDYEAAVAKSLVVPGARPMTPRELRWLLEAVTGVAWQRPAWGWRRTVEAWADTESTLVVVARRPWHWRTLHCVAVLQGWVYDPEFSGGRPVAFYDRRDWRVVQVYRPKKPEQLTLMRQKRLRSAARLRREPISLL